MGLDLGPKEIILLKGNAHLDRYPTKHDGHLVLTDWRLHFEGIEGLRWTYWLDEIVSVRINNVLFFFSHGINIHFGDGKSEICHVYDRENWVSKITIAKVRFESTVVAEPTVGAPESLPLEKRIQLRLNMEKYFDEGELRTLCFDLDFDYDNLEGGTKQGKTREFVFWAERTGKVEALLKLCREERPYVSWD